MNRTEFSELTTTPPRLRLFADIKSGHKEGQIGENIINHLQLLSRYDTSKYEAQKAVKNITHELLTATFKKNTTDEILLIPVLRAGLAMWLEANDYFDVPETSFLMGQKEKGTNQATVVWDKKNNLKRKKIIILDPIIATGDTLINVCKKITDNFPTTRPPKLTVIACYAAPEGVNAVLERTSNVDLIVGCTAETVDANGYLVPPTYGDIGDKLFGRVSES